MEFISIGNKIFKKELIHHIELNGKFIFVFTGQNASSHYDVEFKTPEDAKHAFDLAINDLNSNI